MDPTIIAQTVLGGAAAGGIYALVAIGFGLIYRTTRVFNFAQGGFGALGAYIAFSVTGGLGMPVILAAFVACVAVGLLAVIVERLALRPLYPRGELFTYVSTIGLGFAIESGIQTIWGPIPRTVPSVFGDQPIDIVGLRIIPQVVWVLGISLLVAALTHALLVRTRVGTAMRACAQDRGTATLLGIDPNRMFALAFFLSGSLGALAGVLFAPIGILQPTLGTTLGLPGFIAALVGGLGSMGGAVAGGLILGISQSLAVLVAPPEYSAFAAYIVLTSVILIRPSGLFGEESTRARDA